MKSYRRWITITILLALAATGAVVLAQDKQPDGAAKAGQKVERDVLIQRGGEFVFAGQEPDIAIGQRFWFGDGGTGMFISSEMMTGNHTVKGAPYSAQAVTESVQTLADGNRIVRKTSSSVYRDGEGRTRNEQTVGDVGPYATANEPSQVIMINDPVGGAHYMLDPRTKTARKIAFSVTKTLAPDGKTASNVTVQVAPPALVDERAADIAALKVRVEAGAVTSQRLRVPEPKMGMAVSADAGTFNVKLREPKIEPLGKQVIEGVEAEGQRATITIPAGEIGNELPILIVSENWYSPELQATVMSRHSDPRMGETVYKLTNINRAEPAHALFEVPSDYAIKEVIEPKMKMMLDRELQRSHKPADKQND